MSLVSDDDDDDGDDDDDDEPLPEDPLSSKTKQKKQLEQARQFTNTMKATLSEGEESEYELALKTLPNLPYWHTHKGSSVKPGVLPAITKPPTLMLEDDIMLPCPPLPEVIMETESETEFDDQFSMTTAPEPRTVL